MTSDTSPSLRQSDAFSRKIQYRYKITSSLSRMMAHYLCARCRSSERGCKWRAAVFLRSIFSRESFALLISILRRKINVVAPLRREAVADAARAVAVVRILEVMNNEDDLKSVKKCCECLSVPGTRRRRRQDRSRADAGLREILSRRPYSASASKFQRLPDEIQTPVQMQAVSCADPARPSTSCHRLVPLWSAHIAQTHSLLRDSTHVWEGHGLCLHVLSIQKTKINK